MKSSRRFFSSQPILARSRDILLASALPLFIGQASRAFADTFNWDPLQTGTTAGGGLGTWDITSTLWYNGTGNVAWPNTSPSSHSAIFGGTGGVVTVGAPLFINSLTVNSTGYSFVQPTGGSNNITFNGTNPAITGNASFSIAVPVVTTVPIAINGTGGSSTVSISGAVSGSGGGFVVNNGARLTLSSTGGNSFTGAVTVNTGGVLTVSSNTGGNAFGTGSLVLAGGTFGPRYNGSDNANMNNAARPLSVTADSTIDVRRGSGNTTNVTVQMTTLAIGSSKLTITGANSFSFGLTGTTTLSGNATFEVDSVVGSTSKHGLTLSAVTETGGSRGITKTGGGNIGINGTASYTGATLVNAGGFYMNGNLTGTGGVTVASGATFGGSGTIGGATTISGIHAPGALNTIGTQTFSNLLTYTAGSSFQWQLDAALADTAAGVVNAGLYDRIVANGTVSGSSTFAVTLATGTFADVFWDTDKTWDNVISGSGTSNLQNLFTGFGGSGVGTDGTVNGQGHFSFNGNTLVWTAIPEPSTGALISVLAAGALLRRRHA